MVLKSPDHQTYRPGGMLGAILRSTLRASQILISLVIMGIYGRDLHDADEAGAHADSRWVFAEVVAGFSFITSAVYLLPMIRSYKFFPWDGIMFIFWTALFGAFGKLYIGKQCTDKTPGCGRLKVGVWFDMMGMLLWFTSFVVGAILFRQDRHGRSTYTGRSAVV